MTQVRHARSPRGLAVSNLYYTMQTAPGIIEVMCPQWDAWVVPDRAGRV